MSLSKPSPSPPRQRPVAAPDVQHDAQISTWFGVGGRADRFAAPVSADQLRACLSLDPSLKVLGDGANLLVHDAGVRELVVSLTQGDFREFSIDQPSGGTAGGTARVSAGAGVHLPKLVNAAVRAGLAGLDGLVGIPATIGGAIIMNAGGAFGSISDFVERVHAIDRDGRDVVLERDAIPFGYRASGLGSLIITSVDLRLRVDDREACRARLLERMAYKKGSQPLAENSAGCCFKNPTLTADLPGIGSAGQRVSAGMLIDRADGKGLAVGGAAVSDRHANFVVTSNTATAADIVSLMDSVADRVASRFGVVLDREVVVWGTP